MNITIQAIHFEAADKLKSFIDKKISKLERFSDDILGAEVLLKVVKPEVSKNKEASVKLKVKNGELFANKIADTFEESIDLSVEALEKQLSKFKEKTHEK